MRPIDLLTGSLRPLAPRQVSRVPIAAVGLLVGLLVGFTGLLILA